MIRVTSFALTIKNHGGNFGNFQKEFSPIESNWRAANPVGSGR